MIDLEKLIQLLTDFENGQGYEDNPFDFAVVEIQEGEVQYLNVANAFAQNSVEDMPALSPGDLVAAGLVQGICIGYQYAKES